MSSAPTRLRALDTLRAFAVLWVVCVHLVDVKMLTSGIRPLFAFFDNGRYGVDLFFVLSGFLIGGIVRRELAETGTLQLGRFWWRRWMRTLPAYFAVLGVIRLSDVLLADATPWENFPSYLVFLQSYATRLARFGWSWSLCVEEHFYLALPLLALGLKRGRATLSAERVLQLIAGAALVLSLGARAAHWLPVPPELRTEALGRHMYFVTHFRLDGLAVGLLLAAAPRVRLSRAAALGLLGAAALLVAGCIASEKLMPVPVIKFLVLAVAFGAAVFALLGHESLMSKGLPGDTFVADISYALYLVHPICIRLVQRKAAMLPKPGQILIAVALSFLAAYALRRLVERPFLRLRDRHAKPRSEPVVSLAP